MGTLAVTLSSQTAEFYCGDDVAMFKGLFKALGVPYEDGACTDFSIGSLLITHVPLTEITTKPTGVTAALSTWAKANNRQFCGDATTKVYISIITDSQNPSYPDSRTMYACSAGLGNVTVPAFCC